MRRTGRQSRTEASSRFAAGRRAAQSSKVPWPHGTTPGMFEGDEENDDPEVLRRRINRKIVIWLVPALVAFLFGAFLAVAIVFVIAATIRACH